MNQSDFAKASLMSLGKRIVINLKKLAEFPQAFLMFLVLLAIYIYCSTSKL